MIGTVCTRNLEALELVASGDTVLVHCGTYTEQGLQMVDGVTLRSETGDPDCVIIENAGGDPIMTCDGLPGLTNIEGITFTSAPGVDPLPTSRGAGLLIRDARPTITNCVFTDLQADYGGAVYCGNGASPVFSRCTFTDNSARAVGGAMNCI